MAHETLLRHWPKARKRSEVTTTLIVERLGGFSATLLETNCLQCFDAVGWAAWRAPGLWKTERWDAGVVICLVRGADLHTAQLMPLPLTVSCSSKIRIGFTFLVPAHPGNPGQRAVKRTCVCVCVVRDKLAGQSDDILRSTASLAACAIYVASVDCQVLGGCRSRLRARARGWYLLGADEVHALIVCRLNAAFSLAR